MEPAATPTHKVTCPCCSTQLIIDRRTGAVLEERRPVTPDSTGDRYEDIMKKVKNRAAAAEEKFEQARRDQDTKLDRLNALFNDGLKRAQGEDIGPQGPQFD